MAKKQFLINGPKVREYRVVKNLTQADLAIQAILSISVLSKIENGLHKNIRLSTLCNLCLALDCQLHELIIWDVNTPTIKEDDRFDIID